MENSDTYLRNAAQRRKMHNQGGILIPWLPGWTTVLVPGMDMRRALFP